MAWRWCVVGVLVAGCGPSVAIEAFCDEEARIVCEGRQRCGVVSAAVDCSRVFAPLDCLYWSREGLAAKTRRYDATAAGACLAELRAGWDCDTGYSGWFSRWSEAPCNGVVAGFTKAGEACGACEAGLACLVPADGGCGTCERIPERSDQPVVGPPRLGEPCDSPLTDGAGCTADAWCSPTDAGYRCVAWSAPGEACNVTPCAHWKAACIDGLCVAKADLGQACGVAGCFLGLSCLDGVCAQHLALGEACTRADECLRTFCRDGLCAPAPTAGESCSVSSNPFAPCQYGFRCVNDVCVALPVTGEACEGVCASGATCVDRVCVDVQAQVCR